MQKTEDKTFKDQLDNLNAHLVMIKSMKDTQAEEQFCVLLEKAQTLLGDLNPNIAIFYYEYGSYLLRRLQNNMDIFNAQAVPNAQQDDFIDEYDQAYDGYSDSNQNGANQDDGEKKEKIPESAVKQPLINQEECEKVQKQQKIEQKILYEDGDVQITQVDDKMKQKMQQNNQNIPNIQGNDEQQLTDIEISYQNLQAALQIYDKQLQKIQNGEFSLLNKSDIIKYKFHTHGKLGQLYMLDQKYDESINQFKIVVKMSAGFENPQSRRVASQAHYNIGACLLHQNNSGCQQLAINEYVGSIIQLLKYMEETQHYDISSFELPTIEKPKVDRYKYLTAPFDSDIVKDLKEVISQILDKIQDTYEQIGVRSVYQAEKQKINKQKQESVFKQVPKDVKVTNLGTFGNRKRNPASNQANSNQQANVTKVNINGNYESASKSNSISSSVKNPESSQKVQTIKQEQPVKDLSLNQNGQKKQQKVQSKADDIQIKENQASFTENK